MIIELKYDGSEDGAIAQIKNRNYPQLVSKFSGKMLLVGINYDKATKHHQCRIENIVK